MKIIGTVSLFSSYRFTITTGAQTARLDLYRSDLDTGEQLELWELDTKSVAKFNPFIIGSAIITKKGTITKYYGSLEALSTVIIGLSRSSYLIELSSGRLEVGEYTSPGCTIQVYSKNSNISSATAISGLKYTPLAVPIEAGGIRAGATLSKLKTYKDFVVNRDMSWYIDSSGKPLKDYRLIQSLEELKELMIDADKYEYLSFDTETTGTNFYWYKNDHNKRSKICGMSLSWRKDQGIYIPFMSEVFVALDLAEVMEIVYPIMRKKRVVCHNGMFDFKVLYSYGYYIPISEDTLLMEFNIDPNVQKGAKGLKTLTRKYLNHETIELEELMGGQVVAELIPYIDSELIKVYACSDSDYTLQIFNLLKPYVGSMNSYKLDCMLIEILAIAEYQGAPINEELLNTMSQINKKNMQVVESFMFEYIRRVGTQNLAVRAIKGVQGEAYVPSEEEILALCQHEEFLQAIAPAFKKQIAGHTSEDLQFSAPMDITYILYDLLEYPVLKTNDKGNRSSDKEAIQKLLEVSSTQRIEFLKEDILTSAPEFGVNSTDVVISKKKFEEYAYPFAYLLSVWRKLQKFDSSFFGPLLAENSDGYYYTDNSMTSAETARVINKIQTLEGSLKELVVPRDKDWYMIVFDKSQIEYRVMLGLAANYWNALVNKGVFDGTDIETVAKSKNLEGLIENLNNWEKDYHREGGSIFAGCTPDTMTKKQRKSVKAIHFSVPYGAEAASVARPKLAGRPESEYADIIAETEAELSAWRNKLYPLYYYLEHVRDKALEPISTNPPGHYGLYGKVSNALGRYRLFNLDDDSFAKKSSIRRAAGNYPIQSLARDIFFSGIHNLFCRLQKEGIVTEDFNTSKAVLNLFVHDEVVIQVHKSIHPYRMYKYIMETNLTRLPGHPTYFMGIAVTDTWGKGKTDSYEAPIAYANECIKEYEANQDFYDHYEDNLRAQGKTLADEDYTKLCWDGIVKWFAGRTVREFEQVMNGKTCIDPVFINDNMINYYVKSRLGYYSQPCRKSQYLVDATIAKEANDYMRLIDYYLYITGAYKKYTFMFEGKEIPYSEVLVDLFNDFDDLLDEDYDFDIPLSDMDEDYAEREERAVEDYYNIQEGILTIPFDNPKPKEEEEHTKAPEISLFCETPEGNLVVFVNGLSPKQFKDVSAFLKKFVVPKGKGMPLHFFNTHEVDSGVCVNPVFSQQDIMNVIRNNSTSYFQ